MLLLALIQLGEKEVTDWRKNFDIKEKTPFGLYIFNREADDLLNGKLSRTVLSPFSFYKENQKKKAHNILLIQKEIAKTSWNKILEQVSSGSDAMILSTYFPKNIQDTLKISMSAVSFEEETVLKLTDKKFLGDSLVMDKFPESKGFSYIGQNNEILGVTDNSVDKMQPNFMKVNFGKGYLYLHSDPTMLTNYYLLKPVSEKYIQDVFSYLPNRETIWFVDTQEIDSLSPLSFILSKPALRYAWWLFLAGLLLFAIFHAKRKQRVVPIIEPLKNKSVEFVKSIGNLYLQEGDFHDMMAKKAQYFLNRIRIDLLIGTQNLDDAFAKKLQLKTGKSIGNINEAISLIKKAQDPYASVMKEDLIRMNKLLDEILK